jgi:DNA-binding NarL/FixJ family response regulator
MLVEEQSIALALMKNCPRCGQTSHAHGSAYLCGHCKQPKTRARDPRGKELTFRERQIIRLVSLAKLNKEIAFELHLSEGTIKEYLHRIFRKVGVRNRTDLALWCLANQNIAA